ncbi:MAG: Uma2 family endonuclease [Myxococcales bacterium]|nr:Uma2 family endonuclease [Myxococcales bacterium]
MITGARGVRRTYEDYVDLEELSAVKHEFLDGEIYAMGGGTPEHARLAARLILRLGAALEGGPCAAFSSDLCVRVDATGLATYPDVTVICGEPEVERSRQRAVTNPTLLVEVTSPSTAAYDRGVKLGHYRHIVSLREVVIVAHDERRIEIHRREADGSWSQHVARAGEVLRLASVACALSVDDVYQGVTVSPAG